MRRWKWMPSTIKYKLFWALLLFVFLPLFILQIQNYSQIEEMIRDRVNRQTTLQIQQVKENFDLIHDTMLRTALELENDPAVYNKLSQASDGNEYGQELENLLIRVNARTVPSSAYLYYNLLDMHGKVYNSYTPTKVIQANSIMEDQAFALLKETNVPIIWLEEEMGDIGVPGAGERRLVLMTVFKKGEGPPFGYLRISFDYDTWLRSMVRNFPVLQDYFFFDETGHMLTRTRGTTGLDQAIIDELKKYSKGSHDYYDSRNATLFNSQYFSDTNWILVSQFPLESYIGDINGMKRQYFISFALLVVLFVLVTFAILSGLTRPLKLIQRKMYAIVGNNFYGRLNEGNLDGEVLALAQSFNHMIDDIHELLNKLRIEEKQKEAMHFQMLLSQMNPHFLLNTLNMVKWQAMCSGDQDIAEVCLKLGKLLETSLNMEVDLIFLKDELELADAYVYIMQKRWQYPFSVHYEVENELLFSLVPKLSLQLLIENSIHHGFSKIDYHGQINISIVSMNSVLRMIVEDNGVGLEHAGKNKSLRKRKGIGLMNLKERLRLLFKMDAKFTLEPRLQGTRACIEIPLLISNPYKEGENDDVESGSY
jgi:two-component system sensor histidine kinase YesM